MNTASDHAVELSMTIHATPATVFRFFTDPARFARWWAGPGGGKATIEPRVGGAVRIEYQGGRSVMAGRVLEIDEPRRFVFSWGYESGNDAVRAGSTRVEITLEAVAEGTALTLRHLGLPTPEQRAGHRLGWRHSLSCMAAECSRDQFAGALPGVLGAWFEAWGTDDPGARRGALGRCAGADIEMRDAFACVRGLDDLSDHIGNARRHMPGLALVAAGAPDLVHGFVRFPWKTAAPDGTVVISGVNVGTLGPDGLLRRVVGFWNAPGAG